MKGHRYNLMRANNKIKKPALPEEDLEVICQAIERNKEHLESFCQRNNMKFPPIAQPPTNNQAHLSSYRLRPYPLNQQSRSLRKFQSQHMDVEGGRVQWIEKKASICKITFFRKHPQQTGVHPGRINTNRSNQNILRKQHLTKRQHHSQDKACQILGDFNTQRTTTLHHFIEELNLSHTRRDSKALAYSQPSPSRINRYQLLSINRMCTINPEAELMQTLRGRNLSLERSPAETTKPNFNTKDLSKISFYRQTGQFMTATKKSSVVKKKDGPFLEPWEGALQEEDMMLEMDK